MALELTIIVPAFNEAHRLEDGMDRFGVAVDKGAVDLHKTEILVIDDGSSDGTAQTARKVLAPIPHHRVISLPRNSGKGAAVRAGIVAARGAVCAYMDADMAIDPQAIPLLVDGLANADIAIGSRALPDSMVETRYVARSLMGGLFNRLVTTGTGLGLHDTQCGFKAFRTPAARLLFHLVRIDRFAFDVGVLAMAGTLGLSITEVPVQWRHVPGSTVHPLHDSLPMLADVYRSRLGFRAVPPIPALVVSPRAADTVSGTTGTVQEVVARVSAAADAVAADSPLVLVAVDCGVLVLLPLLASSELSRVGAAFAVELPDLVTVRKWLSPRSLRLIGPLSGRLLSTGNPSCETDVRCRYHGTGEPGGCGFPPRK